jgi:hypothetical protein
MITFTSLLQKHVFYALNIVIKMIDMTKIPIQND